MPDNIDYTRKPDNPAWEMSLNGLELVKHFSEIIDAAYSGADNYFCVDCVEGDHGPMVDMQPGKFQDIRDPYVFQPEGGGEPVCPECGSSNLRKTADIGSKDDLDQRISPEMARAQDTGVMGELAFARIKGVIDDWVAQGGIAAPNARRFLNKLKRVAVTGTYENIRHDPANAMKAHIYNFIMMAMDPKLVTYYPNQRFTPGRGLDADKIAKQRARAQGRLGTEDIEIMTMGHLLTEDGMDYRTDMTKELMEFIRFVNSQGFAVCMREDLQGLTGFDEPLQDADPQDAGMETMDDNGAAEGGGETPVPDQEGKWNDMPAGGPAIQSLLDWAETNGCDPSLCDQVRTEIGEADADAGIPPCEMGEEQPPEQPEPEAPAGAGPLRSRATTGTGL